MKFARDSRFGLQPCDSASPLVNLGFQVAVAVKAVMTPIPQHTFRDSVQHTWRDLPAERPGHNK